MSAATLGVAAALGSTASWALCGVLFKRLGERLDPIGMTVAKSLVAAALIFAVVLSTGGWTPPSVRSIILLAASGIVGVAIGDSFFFAALSRLSPLLLAILLLAGPDVLSGVLGLVCLGEFPCWQVWCGIAAIMAAMGLLMFPIDTAGGGRSTVRGIAYGVIALACTAVGSVIAKPALVGEAAVPSLEATALRMAAGGIVLCAFGAATGRCGTWFATFRDARYAICFAGVTALVAFGGFWLSLAAIKNLEIVTAGALLSLEPLFVLPMMILFGRHKTCLREVAGMVLAVVGVVAIAVYSAS